MSAAGLELARTITSAADELQIDLADAAPQVASPIACQGAYLAALSAVAAAKRACADWFDAESQAAGR